MNIILMGAQGSGKGTQAAVIGPKLNLAKVATGELFRAAIADGTELGVQVKSILDRGDLVPDELTNAIVAERLSGRRVCPVCGTVYHLDADPPRIQGVCDREGATLVQRDDDTPDAIRRRLENYDLQTAPLLSYYDERGLVTRIDGNQAIAAVTDAILDAIAAGEAS